MNEGVTRLSNSHNTLHQQPTSGGKLNDGKGQEGNVQAVNQPCGVTLQCVHVRVSACAPQPLPRCPHYPERQPTKKPLVHVNDRDVLILNTFGVWVVCARVCVRDCAMSVSVCTGCPIEHAVFANCVGFLRLLVGVEVLVAKTVVELRF